MAVVTINTDASYHPYFKVGAYSFWIVCEGVRTIQSGPLKSVISAHDAEIQCIGNALYAISKWERKDIKYVVVNTDCQYAIKAVRDNNKEYYKDADVAIRFCQDTIKKLRKKFDIGPAKFRKRAFISWRYVKAHSEGENARLWVNNWLDKAAKKALWDKIKEKEAAK